MNNNDAIFSDYSRLTEDLEGQCAEIRRLVAAVNEARAELATRHYLVITAVQDLWTYAASMLRPACQQAKAGSEVSFTDTIDAIEAYRTEHWRRKLKTAMTAADSQRLVLRDLNAELQQALTPVNEQVAALETLSMELEAQQIACRWNQLLRKNKLGNQLKAVRALVGQVPPLVLLANKVLDRHDQEALSERLNAYLSVVPEGEVANTEGND